MYDRIKKLANKGREHKNWYDTTLQVVKDNFPKRDVDIAAKFLAVTSMNASLKTNVALTIKAYYQYKNGIPFTGFIPAAIDHLNYVVNGEKLTGRKVRNFAHAILGKKDAVVVDLWMLRAFDIGRKVPTKKVYDDIQKWIIKNSDSFGMSPRQLQAAVWCGIKGKNSQLTYREIFAGKTKTDLFCNKTQYTKTTIYKKTG